MEQQELNLLLEIISCTFQLPRHVFEEPVILPCGKSACKNCILKAKNTIKDKFMCEYCSQSHKLTDKFLNENSDLGKVNLINNKLKQLYDFSINKLENFINNVENRLENFANSIETKKFHIENELLIKVEALKEHLLQLEQEIKGCLNKSAENLNENLSNYKNYIKPELENIRLFIAVSKTNSDLKTENTINHIGMLNINLEKVDKAITIYLNELNFDVNNELPNEEIIGCLNKIKLNDRKNDEIIMEKFKSLETLNSLYQNIPITPRYLAINKDLVYLTDSLSKSVLKLCDGKFEKSLLQNKFKSPEGISFNELDDMYITDYETNLVHKFDKNLNIVKSFGSKILKYPRGIVCDDIDHNSMVYVCDYRNSRCVVFNEHGQFHNEFKPFIDKTDTLDCKNESFLPFNIAVNKAKIFVTDDWTGGNCIRVFSKTDKTLIHNISNLECYNPCGLLLDKINNYLYTFGHLYYENGSLHLFCFDLNSNDHTNLVRKMDLSIYSNINDVVFDVVNSKLYLTAEKQLQIFQF